MEGIELLKTLQDKVRVPGPNDYIYKDQCIYSFDTPESPSGLFVCLRSFLGVGEHWLDVFTKKTGAQVFLQLRRWRVPVAAPAAAEEPEKKVTRLAIGVEGGFASDPAATEFVVEEQNWLVLLPGRERVPLPCDRVPQSVQAAVAAVLAAESASRRQELAAAAATWDGEVRALSKHAQTLRQLQSGVKVPPSGWQCQQCDKTDNLWLNLSDGAILCGRRFFDGTGGNNHAVEHYQRTGYPLAVKLGTISADADADVFSYAEDDMVLDPLLGQHLAHFGINVQAMKKTDKSMVELEIEGNQRLGEWAAIQEEGQQLVPVYGPGYTGLRNLGNTCYINSVMQVLLTVPDFVERYYANSEATLGAMEPSRVPEEFEAQMCKLAAGLLSGKYSTKPPDNAAARPGIEPVTFKSVVGRGHALFSGKKQQDAQEFYLHLLNLISRSSRHCADPGHAFRFKLEERWECCQSHQVKYTHRADYFLPLHIPMETADNKQEVREYEARRAEDAGSAGPPVRPRIPFSAVLEAFSRQRRVEQFYSAAVGANTAAQQSVRLASFPDYLLVQLNRFTVGDDWVPVKLDVSVEVPDQLDLSALRGSGLRPGEVPLPEPAEAEAAAAQPTLDPQVLAQLQEMGFPLDGCKRAVHATQNSGVEPAMNWIMEHLGDADFAAPFVVPGAPAAGGPQADPEAVALIVGMGFTRAQAERALRETNNSVERAADWIFSHQAELEAAPTPTAADEQYRDGAGTYRLCAFISHMGSSTLVGHYVCHILKEGRWCIFNDEKVAESRQPPKELAYLYLYRRVDE